MDKELLQVLQRGDNAFFKYQRELGNKFNNSNLALIYELLGAGKLRCRRKGSPPSAPSARTAPVMFRREESS